MDPFTSDMVQWADTYLKMERLPDLAVLLIGVIVGLVAKNLYTVVKGMLGFAGSFIGRLFVGWWQDIRREAPNVIDVSMAVPVTVGRDRVLLMDSLIGPEKLTDIYINPRTAFGVRIQAFFTKRERPWVYFPVPKETRLARFIRERRNRSRLAIGHPAVTLRDIRRIKYRRVYQPIEALIGQYLTNEWATMSTLGESAYLFRFIVVIVYEKFVDDYIDRQFHVLVIWDHLLETIEHETLTAAQPEFRHRPETLRRLATAFREAGDDASFKFGSILVAMPKSALSGSYEAHPVITASGAWIPVHRPAGAVDPGDLGRISRFAGASLEPEVACGTSAEPPVPE
jgi:uncharacterized membrane protein YeaQ/YmgE (transglycosylase-associated protein family)